MSDWQKADLTKLKELQDNLKKMRTVVQAQRIKELEKLEKVLDVFDAKTQDQIRKVANVGTVD